MKAIGIVAIHFNNSNKKMRIYALSHFDIYILLYQQTKVTYLGCVQVQDVPVVRALNNQTTPLLLHQGNCVLVGRF